MQDKNILGYIENQKKKIKIMSRMEKLTENWACVLSAGKTPMWVFFAFFFFFSFCLILAVVHNGYVGRKCLALLLCSLQILSSLPFCK